MQRNVSSDAVELGQPTLPAIPSQLFRAAVVSMGALVPMDTPLSRMNPLAMGSDA